MKGLRNTPVLVALEPATNCVDIIAAESRSHWKLATGHLKQVTDDRSPITGYWIPMTERTHDIGSTLSICTLASGSKGNSIYVSDGRTRLLVDAGLSAVEIQRRMSAVDLDPNDLDALIVSHEHSDHIQGIGVLSRRYKLPVYLSRATMAAAYRMGKLHSYDHFQCGEAFEVNTLRIRPFSISHDARDPAGFTIARNGKQIGIATDLGKATAMVADHLRQCGLVVLEANHDPKMLENGPYPWHLKQRIRSRNGHLSNPESRDLLSRIRHSHLKYVILAHLSETNNTAQTALSEVGSVTLPSDTKIIVAEQHRPGPILSI